MTYKIKIDNQRGEIHSEEFKDILDLFKGAERLVKEFTYSTITLYGGTDKELLFRYNYDDLLKFAYTKDYKNLSAQDIYKLQNDWLEIAYNLHNNNTKLFLSTFKKEHKLSSNLQEIKFTDGTWISIIGQNISEEDDYEDFNCIINNEGLKVICTTQENKVKILNYKLEEIEYFISIDFRNNCEFKYVKE